MKTFDFDSQMAAISARVQFQEKALFGNRRKLPADEFEIVFSRLSFEEKLSKLTVIREAKAIRRAARKEALAHRTTKKAVLLPFPSLISDADKFHANSLGIRLD